jgi:surfactin synthase thioesterase subunit
MLRADFQLGETYRYRPYPLLSCPISATPFKVTFV